jgi:hypothetical protein
MSESQQTAPRGPYQTEEFMQVKMLTSLQFYKFTSLQVCKSASLQVMPLRMTLTQHVIKVKLFASFKLLKITSTLNVMKSPNSC